MVENLNLIIIFVMKSQFNSNFFKSKQFLPFQIEIKVNFDISVTMIYLTKLSLLKFIFCIELYLNFILNIYISIIY